eukprot:scaffold19454_cov72-Skeletonema_marinoi.AAC.1
MDGVENFTVDWRSRHHEYRRHKYREQGVERRRCRRQVLLKKSPKKNASEPGVEEYSDRQPDHSNTTTMLSRSIRAIYSTLLKR